MMAKKAPAHEKLTQIAERGAGNGDRAFSTIKSGISNLQQKNWSILNHK